jgi:hypothetical protein
MQQAFFDDKQAALLYVQQLPVSAAKSSLPCVCAMLCPTCSEVSGNVCYMVLLSYKSTVCCAQDVVPHLPDCLLVPNKILLGGCVAKHY